MSRRIALALMLGILLLAVVLRLWGTDFGLPYVYHYDEHFYVNTALKLGAGVLNNPPYAATGLSNILFGEYASYYLVGKVLGIFASPQDLEVAYRTDPTMFYLLARGTVAVLGVATVAALCLLGRTTSGTAVGLISAAFLASGFLHVRDSHYSVPDATMPCFVVLAVALAAVGMRRADKKYVYLASLAGACLLP